MHNTVNIIPDKFTPELSHARWEAAGRPAMWVGVIDFPCGTTLCAETGVVIFVPAGIDMTTHELDWNKASWG
jgi:hypothetical protein